MRNRNHYFYLLVVLPLLCLLSLLAMPKPAEAQANSSYHFCPSSNMWVANGTACPNTLASTALASPPVIGNVTPGPAATIDNFIPAGLGYPTITISQTGTPGTTSYIYIVVGTDSLGKTRAAQQSTLLGNATLSGSNYNVITSPAWPGSPYLTPSGSCIVYRTSGGGSVGIIGTIPSCASGGSLNDTGLSGDGTVPPIDTSGVVNTFQSPTVMLSADLFGIHPDSVTDNTPLLNNAIASLPSGVGLYFPCNGGGQYLFSGGVNFAGGAGGQHAFQGPSPHSTTTACVFLSNASVTTGSGAAFSFVGASYVTINGIRFHCNNSASPSNTCITFGTTVAGNGSDYFLDDLVEVSGYAGIALVYSIGSEVLRDNGTTMILNGGGAKYIYYTSGADDLTSCSTCISSSNTAQWHHANTFADFSGTTTAHHAVGIGGSNTGTILFDGGYISAENTGGVAYGDGFYLNSSNGGPITVEDYRLEQGTAFFTVAGSLGSVRHISVFHNNLANSDTGGAYFFNGSASGNTFYAMEVYDNQINTPGGTDFGSGIGDSFNGGVIASYIREPFTVGGGIFNATPGGYWAQCTSSICSQNYQGLSTFNNNNTGSTPTDDVLLTNTSNAALNAQQYSPAISFLGNGWQTNTSGNQHVNLRAYLKTVQGAANPTGVLNFDAQVNGAGYINVFQIHQGAPSVASNAGTASLTNGTDNSGSVAVGTASTTTTLTYGTPFTSFSNCSVSASTSTALPYVSAISATAVTFTYVTTGTPTLYYNCNGR